MSSRDSMNIDRGIYKWLGVMINHKKIRNFFVRNMKFDVDDERAPKRPRKQTDIFLWVFFFTSQQCLAHTSFNFFSRKLKFFLILSHLLHSRTILLLYFFLRRFFTVGSIDNFSKLLHVDAIGLSVIVREKCDTRIGLWKIMGK